MTASLLERVSAGVCRRAFSSPEAILYEWCIAPAVGDAGAQALGRFDLGSRVLDVGAGGGLLAARLVTTSRNLVGVDPSSSQVRRFARRASNDPALRAVRATAERLPFADASFDGLISCCAVKHWPDPRAGLRECRRVSRANARIVLVEVDGEATEAEFAAFAATTRVPPPLRPAYTRFAMRTVVGVAPDRAELSGWMADAGITLESIGRIESAPFLMASGCRG